MVQESLVEYIRRLLQQGYEAETIRTTLLNAGYSSVDVDAAMSVAGAPTKRFINTRILIVAFLVLLVLAGGVLIVLKLMQPPAAVLGFSLSLFSTKVSPGQDLVVNVDVQNPSGRSVSGLIDFVVSGPSGKVASKTESFSLTARTSVPATIALPSDVPLGMYTLQVTLSYKGKSSSQSASFDVVERVVKEEPVEALKERAVEEARALGLTCPGGCDDLNFCTSDACVNGECVHTALVPCCGNGVCESGEDASSCVLDCSPRPVGPDEIRQRAVEMAPTNIIGAMEVCESMAQRVLIDGCLNAASEVSGRKEPCPKIVDSDVRDSCFIAFAYKNDFSVCADISNPYMKNSCLSLAQLSSIQASLPQQ
ncbi:hypothetical protein KY319_03850 [Candidatus Woesearchaeota archaeon]|nr:hypothetical protein [Candidatus Woesearchaeota archaeon]